MGVKNVTDGPTDKAFLGVGLAAQRSTLSRGAFRDIQSQPNPIPNPLIFKFFANLRNFLRTFSRPKKNWCRTKNEKMRYVWWWFTLFSRILILSEKSFEEVLIIIVMIADYPAVRWEGVQFAHFGLWILSWAAVTNNEETRVREHLLKKECFLSGIARITSILKVGIYCILCFSRHSR